MLCLFKRVRSEFFVCRRVAFNLHNLQLDTDQLRAMGCEYVISAAEIENSTQHGLRLERQFSSSGSFWNIYLYFALSPVPAHVAPANQAPDDPTRKQTGETNELQPYSSTP